MERVLITAIGSFSADIVIKKLKQAGYYLVGTDIYPKEWIADAYNVDVFYQVPKTTNEFSYLKCIKSICREHNISYLIPLTDVEVDFYNKHRLFFKEIGISICISGDATIRICRNKKLLEEFIIIHEIPILTIPTYYLFESNSIPFDLPIIAKPVDGRSSQGLIMVNSLEEWKNLKSCCDNDKYIVQPKIEGKVVTVDVIRDNNGKQFIATPRLELLRTLNGAGTSVKVFYDKQLEEQCKKLADALNIIGCVNFEFIFDSKGNYHFIECNPRFSGGVEFSCLAGYDYVLNHIRCFMGKDISSSRERHEMYIARKYEEYITERL